MTNETTASQSKPASIGGDLTALDKELMPKRAAFLQFCKSRSLDVTERKDAWGNRTFAHSHVEAMWYGWFNAPATPNPARTALTDAQITAGSNILCDCSPLQYLHNVCADVLLALHNCDRQPLAKMLADALKQLPVDAAAPQPVAAAQAVPVPDTSPTEAK